MLIRRTTARPGRGRGFTLVELMIAFALVGMLLALGVPSFTAWIRNAQVRSVSEGLQNGIRLAQAEAVRRNRVVVFSLTNGTPALNSTAVANGKNWALQTVAQFGGESASFVQGGALGDVASSVAVAGPAAICFNSNGRLAAVLAANTGVPGATCSVADSTYNVTLSSADRPLRVTVGLAGQVRMCDPNRPTLASGAADGC